MDLLEALKSEHTSGKSLSITHVDSSVLYVSEPDDALLLVEVANVYVINLAKTAKHHSLSLYSAARTVLVELLMFYRKYAADM